MKAAQFFATGLVALASWVALPVWAHKPSDSYLSLAVQGTSITGQWDIALRDLDFALGLDADGDGTITWGELKARHKDIAAYAGARLQVQADGAACAVQVGAQQVDEHTDGAYTVLPLVLRCGADSASNGQANSAPKSLTVAYQLFADLDPQHRGLLKLQSGSGAATSTRTAVLVPQATADAPAQLFELKATGRWQAFVEYLREGVWHIWIGFDHILFLLALLLPAVGSYVAGARSTGLASAKTHWQPASRFAPVVWDVLRVVTAFTAAHSVTLSLATLGWVSLPSRAVESAIALSVVLAALNNVWPLFQGRRWWVAFAFGLIHGFGFASVLAELGLPAGALGLALVGFNVGVELGQLAIVAVFLPLAFALRRTTFYRVGVLIFGSLAVAALAAVWLAERAFNLQLLPS
jgi:HupE / UreJ protein